jgi:hypothetical protein
VRAGLPKTAINQRNMAIYLFFALDFSAKVVNFKNDLIDIQSMYEFVKRTGDKVANFK